MKLNNIYLVTSIVLITIGLQSYAQEYSITSDSNQVNILFENLSKESLKTHLKYLASDELKGRNMDDGSDLMASEYIQSQFKAFHLEQIDNSWTQEFTVHYPVFNSYTLSNQNHTVTIDSLLISIGFEDIDGKEF